MIDSVVEVPPPAIDPDPNCSSEFDSVAIPPFDHLFLTGSDQEPVGNLTSDLWISLDGDEEFDLTLDGIDDLYFPAENETFFIPATAATDREHFGDFTPESEGSGISGDCIPGDEDKNANYLSSSSGCSDRESHRDSGDRCSGEERSLNPPSPISSQGSGNCGSGVSVTMNALSPESETLMVEQKVKVEEGGTAPITKRKKESEEDTSGDSRTSKCRRSGDNASASDVTTEEDEKRNVRLMRNRESAQLSRQRKKHYVEELEEKVRTMHSTIADLNSKISYFMAENATLRQLGAGTGICPPQHHPLSPPGMYPPMAPMHHPWMPCPPYMVKPQGSQMPLIPIPRLKPQQPVSVSKSKKSESKKSEPKTKKVASISFLGLLLCLFLFGALAPIVNINYGGISGALYGEYRSDYITNQVLDQHKGRVLDVNGRLSRSGDVDGSGTEFSNSNGAKCRIDTDGRAGKSMSVTDHVMPAGNDSEPLVASLFVPRNDKLVKIDGNLIIHSIVASEKAIATRKASETNNERKTVLSIPEDFSPALPRPDVGRNGELARAKDLYRTNSEKQKALSSGPADNLKDHFKTTAANGKMQQWFREGLAGPMLSSGMCTEVFQFDVSSTSGALIPASPASNVSTEQSKNNTTNTDRGKSRRILRGLPVPLPGSGPEFNLTENHTRKSSSQEGMGKPKPAAAGSSMVVSVLVDPREGGEGEVDDGMMGQKSLSRVFVVVLMDRVKYVTYSCVLPRPGDGPHLVTT
ncbi:PREDICTED: bZIP transcription factor 17 [Tarenaya hassleriana]|uniref:bZIP transcription factor 17 n=1 Tax=Tarenaya hassleriana TaxID=28532 RepID=UPI00053C360C|nr:PREDICTED: bZIP transcription factor 17 [Tarenaya hassleriana]